MQWIDVNEKLPETGQNVLVPEKRIDKEVSIIKWFPTDKEHYTHWMPLPEPPKDV